MNSPLATESISQPEAEHESPPPLLVSRKKLEGSTLTRVAPEGRLGTDVGSGAVVVLPDAVVGPGSGAFATQFLPELSGELNPVLQEQTPPEHLEFEPQEIPLQGSVETHRPFVHCSLDEHALPQVPQFALSCFKVEHIGFAVLPQFDWPVGHETFKRIYEPKLQARISDAYLQGM